MSAYASRGWEEESETQGLRSLPPKTRNPVSLLEPLGRDSSDKQSSLTECGVNDGSLGCVLPD